MPVSILVVCTGNTCRSPMAERLLAHRLAERGVDAVVRSAGTHALEGAPMTEDATIALESLGVDAHPHAAHQLGEADVEGADLVLTATRDHRAIVVSEVPAAVGRTFTLREFARVARRLSAGRGASAPDAGAAPDAEGADRSVADPASGATFEDFRALVARERGVVPPEEPSDDDVADPIGRPQAAYDRTAGELDATASVIAAALAGLHTGSGMR